MRQSEQTFAFLTARGRALEAVFRAAIVLEEDDDDNGDDNNDDEDKDGNKEIGEEDEEDADEEEENDEEEDDDDFDLFAVGRIFSSSFSSPASPGSRPLSSAPAPATVWRRSDMTENGRRESHMALEDGDEHEDAGEATAAALAEAVASNRAAACALSSLASACAALANSSASFAFSSSPSCRSLGGLAMIAFTSFQCCETIASACMRRRVATVSSVSTAVSAPDMLKGAGVQMKLWNEGPDQSVEKNVYDRIGLGFRRRRRPQGGFTKQMPTCQRRIRFPTKRISCKISCFVMHVITRPLCTNEPSRTYALIAPSQTPAGTQRTRGTLAWHSQTAHTRDRAAAAKCARSKSTKETHAQRWQLVHMGGRRRIQR